MVKVYSHSFLSVKGLSDLKYAKSALSRIIRPGIKNLVIPICSKHQDGLQHLLPEHDTLFRLPLTNNTTHRDLTCLRHPTAHGIEPGPISEHPVVS